MKHQVLNLGSVLACVVSVSAGAGTAFAQAQPGEPQAAPEGELTPAPNEPCPGGVGANCPQAQAHPAPPAQPAQPQPYYGEQPQAYQAQPAPHQTFEQRYGLAISAGGGASDWFNQDMRNVTGITGNWEVRGYVGLNVPFGLEVAYIGQASSLEPFRGPNINTTLVGNGVEAAARLNVFHDLPVQPFVIAGISWTHFTTSNDVNLADFGVNNNDEVLFVPLGGGFGFRNWGLYFDARFTFRPALGENLVVSQVPTVDGVPVLPAGTFVDMDNWEASGRVGYEF